MCRMVSKRVLAKKKKKITGILNTETQTFVNVCIAWVGLLAKTDVQVVYLASWAELA